MSAKAIYETDGKSLLAKWLQNSNYTKNKFAIVVHDTNWDELVKENPWIQNEKLVVKPDQLIKRRGKLGLIKVNVDLQQAKQWINERMGKDIQVGAASGPLKRFIIEPFLPHQQSEEFYVCIYAQRNCDTILFHHEGGVEIGDVESKAVKLEVGLEDKVTIELIENKLMQNVPRQKKKFLATFIHDLFQVYTNLFFTYLEINPLGKDRILFI